MSCKYPVLSQDAATKLKAKHPTLGMKFVNGPNATRLLTHARRKTEAGVPETDWVDLLAMGADFLFPELMPLIEGIKPMAKAVKRSITGERKDHHAPADEHAARQLKDVAIQSGFVKTFRSPLSNRPIAPTDMPKVRLAAMASPLSLDDVPVLHGQYGRMEPHPVHIERTENHATMSGTEYLTQLRLLPSQVALGETSYALNINPRLLAGRRIALEAQAWQMFRFRKMIIEYIPIQGSSVTGSFIGYWTSDPTEVDLVGDGAVYNAMEHTNSVMFQPFFHTTWIMPHDAEKTGLYYCHNEPDGDSRLEVQALFKMINNVANTADVSFGSLVMHYEIDFYYPELVQTNTSYTYPTLFAGDAAPTNNTVVTIAPTGSGGTWPVAVQSTMYSAVLTTIPAGVMGFPGTAPPMSPSIGDTVWLVLTQSDVKSRVKVYYNFVSADADTAFGSLYYLGGTLPGASATWAFANIKLVQTSELLMLRKALSACDPLPGTPMTPVVTSNPATPVSTPALPTSDLNEALRTLNVADPSSQPSSPCLNCNS